MSAFFWTAKAHLAVDECFVDATHSTQKLKAKAFLPSVKKFTFIKVTFFHYLLNPAERQKPKPPLSLLSRPRSSKE
jgi:hypothetical protein